jgi:hypothetical protein
VFLIIVAQLYIDSQCRKDLRASAQNLLSFITLGVGWPLGTLLGGWLRETFKQNTSWLFAVPSAAAVVLLVLFWKTVNIPNARGSSTASGGADDGTTSAAPLVDEIAPA